MFLIFLKRRCCVILKMKCSYGDYLVGVCDFSTLFFTLHSLLDVTIKNMDFKNCSKKKSPHHTKTEWKYIFTNDSVPMCFCCNSSYFWPVEDIQEKKLKLGRQPSYNAFHTILSPYCTSMFFILNVLKQGWKTHYDQAKTIVSSLIEDSLDSCMGIMKKKVVWHNNIYFIA